MLTDPAARAAVADLGRRTGHVPAGPGAGRALDFEKERALRALGSSRGDPIRGTGDRGISRAAGRQTGGGAGAAAGSLHHLDGRVGGVFPGRG